MVQGKVVTVDKHWAKSVADYEKAVLMQMAYETQSLKEGEALGSPELRQRCRQNNLVTWGGRQILAKRLSSLAEAEGIQYKELLAIADREATSMRCEAAPEEAVPAGQARRCVVGLPPSALKGKTVLLRLDLEEPLCLDTLGLLIERQAKIVVCGHQRGPGGREEMCSLKDIAKRIGELLGKEVKCTTSCRATDETRAVVSAMEGGDIVVLENTHFEEGEKVNDPELAQSMASLADLYVNDSLGTANLVLSSTVAVTELLPSFSGLQLHMEVDFLQSAWRKPEKKVGAIFGGRSSKLTAIKKLLDQGKVDKLIVGGVLLLPFLKARGLSVGKAAVEQRCVEMAKEIVQLAEVKGVQLILPVDVACGDAFPDNGQQVSYEVVHSRAIPDGLLALDIGPEATAEIKGALMDCRTILWNGPMGVFESSQFSTSTLDIATAVAEVTKSHDALSIIIGGHTLSAVQQASLSNEMSLLCSAGEASLRVLCGSDLPALAALDKAASDLHRAVTSSSKELLIHDVPPTKVVLKLGRGTLIFDPEKDTIEDIVGKTQHFFDEDLTSRLERLVG